MRDRHSQEEGTEWRRLSPLDRHCFGCGTENDHGLGMCFATNGTMLKSEVVMAERFRGWSNLVHGGVLSTMLDEIMGWTVIVLTGRFILTTSMHVHFKRPVRVGASLVVTGWIKERVDERRVVAAAEIRDESDKVCALAEGEFALFNRKQFARMGIMSEAEIDAMEAQFPPP